MSRMNPFIGPRAFRTGERLPARRRETHELTDLLISEQVVLLHSPSGAGKTSLIQAGVTPLLEEEKFRATAPLRVNAPPPPDRAVRNRYVYSVALDLLGESVEPQELEALTLSDVVAMALPSFEDRIPVLMFDQFEEIVTLDPTDWINQTVFFRDLGTVLANTRTWALLSMREDFMGGVDRFVRYVPSHLATTFRLDFLDLDGAKQAVQDLTRSQGVTFADDAVDALLRELRTVRIQRPARGAEETEAPYVEPFQLQITCRKLWRAVRKHKGDDFTEIDRQDVLRLVDVGKALRAYYSDTVAEIARALDVEEAAIRDWFGKQLITEQHFRSQTLTGPATGDESSTKVLQALQDAYLVRGDLRAQSAWYELTHDQLIGPILADNEAWRRARLEPWQLAAREWEATRRGELLLRGKQLRDVLERASDPNISAAEREFLEECARADRERGLIDRTRSALGAVGVLAFVELIVILLMLLLLLRR
jgi:hypothetical protein